MGCEAALVVDQSVQAGMAGMAILNCRSDLSVNKI
jgi:hypothetical protein